MKHSPLASKSASLRLLSYLAKYKIQLTLGFLMAFFASLLNLLALSSFMPIFDILSQEKEVKIFTLNQLEKELLEKKESYLQFTLLEKFFTKQLSKKKR